MTFSRLLLGVCLGAALLTWWLSGFKPEVDVVVQNVALDPYDDPLLSDYREHRDALLAGDTARLAALALSSDSFAAYRSALTLARLPNLPASERVTYYRRVLALRIDDPLDKIDERFLMLEYAQTAEAAGLNDEAVRAFEAALPEAAAAEGLRRLETDSYRLANRFFKARQYRSALAALGELTAPSIEAPAYRALRDYEQALDAYERWLQEQPGNEDARYGKAWTHYYLGQYAAADALFASLPGTSALRGRSLIARQAGDIDRAVTLLEQSGEAAHLWYATGYLEARDRYGDVLPLYLRLARGNSAYADDAAYRAFVLATRLGEGELAQEAKAYLSPNSFFRLKLGESLDVPTGSELAEVTPQAREVSNALARLGDIDGAVGELLFALRKARDPAATVALAEGLQLLGEFRQSQRAANDLLAAGVNDRRVWELAYPRAYAQAVGGEALKNGLEPQLVWAIMRQESAFFPKALSSSDAQGLMQVIPSTWDWLAELQRETPGNPFDIATNVRYGSYYLRWLLDYLGGDVELVIASYNRGQGYIKRLFEGPVVGGDKDELYREIDAFETREYLQRVVVNYEVYKTLYPTLSERP